MDYFYRNSEVSVFRKGMDNSLGFSLLLKFSNRFVVLGFVSGINRFRFLIFQFSGLIFNNRLNSLLVNSSLSSNILTLVRNFFIILGLQRDWLIIEDQRFRFSNIKFNIFSLKNRLDNFLLVNLLSRNFNFSFLNILLFNWVFVNRFQFLSLNFSRKNFNLFFNSVNLGLNVSEVRNRISLNKFIRVSFSVGEFGVQNNRILFNHFIFLSHKFSSGLIFFVQNGWLSDDSLLDGHFYFLFYDSWFSSDSFS